jgi:CRP/FNR family cyclic AMP-dependent transcriptional regulator
MMNFPGEIFMNTIAVLQQADIFHDLTPPQLKRLNDILIEKRYRVGETIFRENDASDELYVIASGEIEILVDPSLVSDQRDAPSNPTTIATLRRGQSFGEVALVDRGVRSATARSAADTHLLVLKRDALTTLCDEDAELGYQLMSNLAADLSMKIRTADLTIREKLLYASRHATKAS